MQLYCAPMEGVTTYLFRQIHHRFYPGIDKYYTPFLVPNQNHAFNKREKRELDPEQNRGLPVVPQLLPKRGDDCLWGLDHLFSLGYGEVNLNLGCPSGTVVAKGKGAGYLRDLDALEAFLDEVYGGTTGRVSIKTRLGMEKPEEFWPILELYNRYPIHELTVHLRVRTDYYREPARWELLGQILEESRAPVCCNGDVGRVEDVEELMARHPALDRFMLGRGLMADPALALRCRGGEDPGRDHLKAFLVTLYQSYAVAFESQRNAMLRMKELWSYLEPRFEGGERLWKRLHKTGDTGEYEDLVERVFAELPLRDAGAEAGA